MWTGHSSTVDGAAVWPENLPKMQKIRVIALPPNWTQWARSFRASSHAWSADEGCPGAKAT
jgi:hypothetical protein